MLEKMIADAKADGQMEKEKHATMLKQQLADAKADAQKRLEQLEAKLAETE
jgi:hypothetical protein